MNKHSQNPFLKAKEPTRQRRLRSGEKGIRTPDTVTRIPHFECGAIDHSAISPKRKRSRKYAPFYTDGKESYFFLDLYL